MLFELLNKSIPPTTDLLILNVYYFSLLYQTKMMTLACMSSFLTSLEPLYRLVMLY